PEFPTGWADPLRMKPINHVLRRMRRTTWPEVLDQGPGRVSFRTRRRTDLGFTRDRHISAQVRKSAAADLRCVVSKDGRWLGLACGRPSRRAQSFEARAPSGARAPQDDLRAPQDEVD